MVENVFHSTFQRNQTYSDKVDFVDRTVTGQVRFTVGLFVSTLSLLTLRKR